MGAFPHGQGGRIPATSNVNIQEWATHVLPTGLLTDVQVISNLLTLVLQAWWKVISSCIKHSPHIHQAELKDAETHKKPAYREIKFVWTSSHPHELF